MRPPAALFRGFRRKCCCANFPIIHLHLHNLFISKGFSHFPQSYPHRYVNSYSAEKIPHFAADSKMRRRPPSGQRRRSSAYPTSIQITPQLTDAGVPNTMTAPASSSQSPLRSVFPAANASRSLAPPLLTGPAQPLGHGKHFGGHAGDEALRLCQDRHTLFLSN